MVSTRGIKTKFAEGEKVLCYEPDPTKAKVLYESKVKDVVINKSKKGVEYLIHFRGWNSSWDRCVNEEYILKDTAENRQLQKDLAEKSKLQFGAYLYRKDKERKKQGRKNSSTSEGATSGGRDPDDNMDTDREDDKMGVVSGPGPTPESPPDRSSCDRYDDDYVVAGGTAARVSASPDHPDRTDRTPPSLLCFAAIELTSELRYALEQDYHMIMQGYRLHRIPAEPNVVTILELYWRYYAANQLCQLHDLASSSARPPIGPLGASKGGKTPTLNHASQPAPPPGYSRTEDAKRNLDVCQEVLDGLRIYFDFTLQDLLLYNHEVGQMETGQAIALPQHKVKSEKVKEEGEDQEYAHLPSLEEDSGDDRDRDSDHRDQPEARLGRRRSLRSYRSLDSKLLQHTQLLQAAVTVSHPQQHLMAITKTESEYSCSNSSSAHAATTTTTNTTDHTNISVANNMISSSDLKIPIWRALPDYVYVQRPPPPSLLYGATHLARLFVKLPDLLAATSISEEKLKILMGHLELFIDFLSEHREWFLDKCYI